MRRLLFLVLLAQFLLRSVVHGYERADSNRIKTLIAVADKELNPDSAIVQYSEVIRLSKEADYPNGAFIGWMRTGIKYHEKDKNAESRKCYEEALRWAPRANEKDAVAWCYNNLGDSYMYEGDYIKASEYQYIALGKVKEANAGPTHTAANVYNYLGIINFRLNQYEKGLEFFRIAEDICKKGGLYFQLAENYDNMGSYYLGLHKTDSALWFFNEVMAIGNKMGKVDLQALANARIGDTYISTGQYQEAITHLEAAIAMAKNRFNYVVADASYSLGDVLYRMGKWHQSEAILQRTLNVVRSNNVRDKYIKHYELLTCVLRAGGHYETALKYSDTLTTLRDSLVGVEKAKAVNIVEAKFKTAEKDKQLAQNQLLIARQKNKLDRKNMWMVIGGCGVVVLAVLLLSIYRAARHKQRLQAEQIRALQQENKIGVLNAIVEGEEKERARIARELHDGIGGMLSASMMRFRSIKHAQPDITAAPAYQEAMTMLGQMGDEIRKTAHNLMPEALQKQDVDEALRSYCRQMQEGAALRIDYQSYGSFGHLSQEIKLNVYRIVQELLKNIDQHAAATSALVQLQLHDSILAITVEDNGRGFDMALAVAGLGLRNLQTRVRNLNGSYTIESAQGRGTSVFIELNPDAHGV